LPLLRNGSLPLPQGERVSTGNSLDGTSWFQRKCASWVSSAGPGRKSASGASASWGAASPRTSPSGAAGSPSTTPGRRRAPPPASRGARPAAPPSAAARPPPRLALVMVKAGEPVDAAIAALAPLLAPGDAVMDGGNSHWRDTERRAAFLAARGIDFLGLGIS